MRVGINIAEDADGNKFYSLNQDLDAWGQKYETPDNRSGQSTPGAQELLQDADASDGVNIRISEPKGKQKATNADLPEKQSADPFGPAYTEFSGKPAEAIEHLLKVRQGHVPAAFHKEGLGDIDLPWGKGGKKGFGLAHIIERRNEQGTDGVEFARALSRIIQDGRLETRPDFSGRAYIVSQDNEAVVRLEWDGKKRSWLVTAYPYTKEKTSEPRLDVEPSDRTFGDEQRLPSPHSEGVEEKIAQQETVVKPASTGNPIEDHRALRKKLQDGKASLEEYQTAFEHMLDNEKAVKDELNKLTVKQLLAMGGPMFAYRHNGSKKAAIVDGMYWELVDDFALGQPVSYYSSNVLEMTAEQSAKTRANAVRKIVESQTEESLADYARQIAEKRAEYVNRVKARAEALENPKTLDDFKAFIRFHIDEGKSAIEARLMLTPEQREEFDRLAAEFTRSERKGRQQPQVATATQTTGGQIIETKHTRDGHDLFVVKLDERLGQEDYLALLSSARKMGGYYSKFRRDGAVPGFQFRTRENAEAFLKLAQGDKTDAQEAAQTQRNAYEDDRSQSAVQRLEEMADRLEADAEARLNADRKVNTAKRARQAASADEAAQSDRALAKTMRNIAKAIKDGKATFLDKVRERKQVEMLRDTVRLAHYDELRARYPDYADRQKHEDDSPTSETMEFAKFPYYSMYRSVWADFARKMAERDGTKMIAKKILSLADDVTEAYQDFARKNLVAVSHFKLQDGTIANYKSRDAAEKALARSGYKGKAIVLPVKRGENRIILSPSAAQERGVWPGDDDRMITLKPNIVDEIFSKLGNDSPDIPWQLKNQREKRRALERMDILSASEYRMALREFLKLQETPGRDRVRELEREVIRDAIKSRGFLDFFPTPAAVTSEMLDAAQIEPGMSVLEPSAGMGHIADRIREQGVEPQVVELDGQKRELLEAKGYEVIGSNFMEDVAVAEQYDRIVMNPPFSKRQDTEHVRRAYELLKPGGRVVAIVSEGSFYGQDKKAAAFRAWLDEVGGTSSKLPEGSCDDPSLPTTTGVNTRMVVIDKSEGPHASLAGEHLPPRREGRRIHNKDSVRRVIDKLKARAANGAKVELVGKASDLPENLRRAFDSDRLEGLYDPATDTVWLVEENLESAERAAEVWAHETLVHHGLRSLFSAEERKLMLTQLFMKVGGMGNARVREIARLYGVDPRSNAANRILVMEELLASTAERRARKLLDQQERITWLDIVSAITRFWKRLIERITGKPGRMDNSHMEKLLDTLEAHVMDGQQVDVAQTLEEDTEVAASLSDSDRQEAEQAWYQLQKDMADWARQVDAFTDKGRFPKLLNVCQTPDVLRKLGAPELPMTMSADNLGKILSSKKDHNLPKDLVKQLPAALAEPIMVFESATQPDSFVVLLELKHEGRPVMAAVHLNKEVQRLQVNDVASVYQRNSGWFVRQIEDGRLLYQDKKKSLAWARTNRLQLPRVRKLPARLSENPERARTNRLQLPKVRRLPSGLSEGRILTDADVVKPVEPLDAPLASLSDTVSAGVRKLRRIWGGGVSEAVEEMLRTPGMAEVVEKKDLSMWERIFKLPHFMAKDHAEFRPLYERQQARSHERASATKKSLDRMSMLFDMSNKDRLKDKELKQLEEMIWKWDGKEQSLYMP